MGGGGGSSTTSTSATYDNKSYVYQGGAVDLSNLLGTLNYKSSGSSFDFNQDKAFTSSIDNKNESTQGGGDGGDGGEGGGLDVAASVGVGLGGGSGSAGAVEKNTAGGIGSSNNSNGSLANPVFLVGIGIATAFVVSQFNKRK